MTNSKKDYPFEFSLQTGHPFELDNINSTLKVFNSLSNSERSEVLKMAQKLDYKRYDAVLNFGKKTQEKLSHFASHMLKVAQKQDFSKTGRLLNDLVSHIDLIEVDHLLPIEQSILSKIFSRRKPELQQIISDFTRLKVRIDRLSIQLEHAQHQLLKDYESFNELYNINEEYFHDINLYIAACELKLAELKEIELPKLELQASQSGDPLAENALRDLNMQIEWIDKRKYDLEISREVAIQSAPQIRMIQQTSQMLIDKIQSSILTTIPVWQQQISIILQMNRQRKLAETEQKIIRASNELSRKNKDVFEATKNSTINQINSTENQIEQFKETQTKLLKDLEDTIFLQEQASKQLQ